MEIKQLHYFIQVYRDGNLSKAAKGLAITQPALSQQIAKLERELGHTLLERNARELRVTPKGRLFLKRAVEIQDALDRLVAEMGEGTEIDELSIAAGGAVSSWLLPPVIAHLKEKFSKTAFQVLEGDDLFVNQALVTGMVDIAISTKPGGGKGIISKYLSSDTIVPVVAKNHPLAKMGKVNLSDLSAYDLLLYHEKSAIQKIIAEKFLTIPEVGECRIAMVLRSLISLIKSVEAGIGIGFISNLAVNNNLTVLNIKGLSCERKFYLHYRESREILLRDIAQEVISYIKR